ncbi:MAG: hypothetical protein JOZ78_13540 [Chroococcidiopsidaceae cyanobacterium CP_BM_ER_R8_30]|nr:hypothetical protein [Chroococcidiopsidaceae cyanobacterium CP_BM_ER_R8_30]
MQPTNDFISAQVAQELLALASHLETQKHQTYVPLELMQAATEAGISVDTLQEALHQMQVRQAQQQARHHQLRLVLSSGLAGVAISLLGVGVYAKLNQQPSPIPQFAADAAPNPNELIANSPTSDGYTATYTGIVQQYLLNPEGQVDGLLLKNGLQAKVPPHLSQVLTNLVHPGTEISFSGTPGTPSRFGQEIRTLQIVNRQTQQSLSVQPPIAPPLPPLGSSNYTNLSAEGTVQHWLVGHRGELNGAVLASGVQIKFAPPVGEQLLPLILGNDTIQVQGFGERSSYGEVIEATMLSINRQTVPVSPPKKLSKEN